jgi:hypothetical protein
VVTNCATEALVGIGQPGRLAQRSLDNGVGIEPVSCPISFDPVQVMEILSISDRYVPVMMRAVGRPASGNNARRPRLPVDQVLFGLSRSSP